ncbi:MAG: type III-A CRISPR-associated protein Csm2 [Magnetococcales bacterium]|nr:type III-A CRISPR-associated protein Csm2 [Magnetococcales bacterium]
MTTQPLGGNANSRKGRNQEQHGAERGGSPKKPKELPAVQKQDYFDKDGKIQAALLDTSAEAMAKSLKDSSHTQLRRFYGDVQKIRRTLDLQNSGSRWITDDRSPPPTDFLMLKAKAVYANGRKLIPDELLQFFINHTGSVKNLKQFDAFCRHFQSVVAFHKYYGKD